jgi:hypothetical protein
VRKERGRARLLRMKMRMMRMMTMMRTRETRRLQSLGQAEKRQYRKRRVTVSNHPLFPYRFTCRSDCELPDHERNRMDKLDDLGEMETGTDTEDDVEAVLGVVV